MGDINKELSPDITGVEKPTLLEPDVPGVEEPPLLRPDIPSVEVPEEPSCVYGYVSLVDPETGEKHVIMNYDYVPPRVRGILEFSVVFRAVDGKETRRVEFRAGRGVAPVAFHPLYPNQLLVNRQSSLSTIAWFYYVPLVKDRSETGDPRYVDDYTQQPPPGLTDPNFRVIDTIRYNPDLWRFGTVEMDPFDFADRDGSIGGPDAERYQDSKGDWRSRIPVTRRAEPFTDLPDIF